MEVEDSGEEEKAGSIASNSAAVATTSSDLFSSAPRMLVHPSAPDAASAAPKASVASLFLLLPCRCHVAAMPVPSCCMLKL